MPEARGMGIFLGLAAALLYGSSDFAGGLASRRISSLTVNVIGAAAATITMWAVLLLDGGPAPTFRAVAWGLAGGLGGGLGSIALYRGLARGQMSVVGPVSAVSAAVIPVVAGLILGERPGPLTLAGATVALPAIGLVASSGSGLLRGLSGAGTGDGLAAGAAFALLFIAMAQAGSRAGLWPVACGQASSLVLITVLKLRARVHGSGDAARMRDRVWLPVLSGLSGMAATLLFFYATHVSMLATAAVLVSLYPGVTVLLARVLLHERFSRVQRFGLGLCAAAIIAIGAH